MADIKTENIVYAQLDIVDKLVDSRAIEEPVKKMSYILYKAAKYVTTDGEYFKDDFFNYPLKEWNKNKLLYGCHEVVNKYTGYSQKYPLENMALIDVCNLFELFHYSLNSFKKIDNNADVYKLNFIHKMDKDIYTAYLKNAENQDLTINELYYSILVDDYIVKFRNDNSNKIIKIYANTETIGVKAEYVWLGEHFKRYKVAQQSLVHKTYKENDIYCDVLEIQNLAKTDFDNKTQQICFDISDFFDKKTRTETLAWKINVQESNKTQYKIDRPEPSTLLKMARELALSHINEKIEKHRETDNPKSFRWIKMDWSYPSFEHFTFAYKNQLFPVFVEMIVNGVSQMKSNEISRFIEAADEFNLIPCIFKVNIESEIKSDKYGYGDHVSIEPFAEDSWNLYDLRNGKPVKPENMGNDSLIEMSEWELLDFAIQIVCDDIKKQGYKLLSYCNLPGINPQIWFKNNEAEECWIIVRYLKDKNDADYRKWIDLENNDALKASKGFFAGVSGSNTFRGEPLFVSYKGLQRISCVD